MLLAKHNVSVTTSKERTHGTPGIGIDGLNLQGNRVRLIKAAVLLDSAGSMQSAMSRTSASAAS
eukprot:6230876-Pyramimonas_sp.AAC.1